MLRSENARLAGWVFVDVPGRDLRSAVQAMQRATAERVALPAGYSVSWSGQFEYLERAADVPACGRGAALDGGPCRSRSSAASGSCGLSTTPRARASGPCAAANACSRVATAPSGSDFPSPSSAESDPLEARADLASILRSQSAGGRWSAVVARHHGRTACAGGHDV
jgi:hypothetical protein